MRNASSTSAFTSTSVVIVEIRAAEGGADAKQLTEDQLAIYERLAARRSL